jgi:hypothetical protein
MTDLTNTPQPADEHSDPDLILAFSRFPIPSLGLLCAVTLEEQKAVTEINAAIRSLARTSDLLVDAQGKPMPMAGGNIAERVKALVGDLLARPILSESYQVGPGPKGGAELQGFEGAGLKLAFITYQGLHQLIQGHLGKDKAALLGNSLDMVVVFSLQAVLNHRNPYRVIEKALRFQPRDAETGAPVLGESEPTWAVTFRQQLADLTLVFLLASEYAVTTGTIPEAQLALQGGEDMPCLSLTESGERLFLHLRDQVSLKIALQDPALHELVQKAAALPAESKTLEQVEADLQNPNAPLHEA